MALPQKGHLCLTVFRLPQLLSINHKKRQPENRATWFQAASMARRSNIRRQAVSEPAHRFRDFPRQQANRPHLHIRQNFRCRAVQPNRRRHRFFRRHPLRQQAAHNAR